ncbi:hypothetical protein [Desulforhopalus singaporensis]|uniref:Uncharacterized protein n=1 Tax=Desulforhopalus singaporensis TaxID=91360 RepID=A0A1H0U639_9BACT|nr:hypothetical protein [Desulforhopalus singaporensis]SDP61752.1 hypothetical protein SAMN05660330_03404 [Desulforhopalus singaporensis]
MSIRLLARDVYRAQQNVDRLRKLYDTCTAQEKDRIKRELQGAEKELALLRKMLDGEKQSGPFRKKFAGFGSTKNS